MLDRQKLLSELSKVQEHPVFQSNEIFSSVMQCWQQAVHDVALRDKIQQKKWSLLVPEWKKSLGTIVTVVAQEHPYTVLAVDGSQIYHDKHQGPACYLLNIGSVRLNYGQQVSRVQFYSEPEIIVANEQNQTILSTEYVNLHREQKELQLLVAKVSQYIKDHKNNDLVCFLDGSLIFFQVNIEGADSSIVFFNQYMQYLQELYQLRILHAGYMSFPKTKDLLNILRIYKADYHEKQLENTDIWQTIVDMDFLQSHLQKGQRSIVFQSKAPISYLYPVELKPHFCYLHVGAEIIRLEFPEWIARDEALVDRLCAVALDQAKKGAGYPVVLFEAHEQAVIKSCDRTFFYEMLQKMYRQKNQQYQFSNKMLKKMQVPV